MCSALYEKFSHREVEEKLRIKEKDVASEPALDIRRVLIPYKGKSCDELTVEENALVVVEEEDLYWVKGRLALSCIRGKVPSTCLSPPLGGVESEQTAYQLNAKISQGYRNFVERKTSQPSQYDYEYEYEYEDGDEGECNDEGDTQLGRPITDEFYTDDSFTDTEDEEEIFKETVERSTIMESRIFQKHDCKIGKILVDYSYPYKLATIYFRKGEYVSISKETPGCHEFYHVGRRKEPFDDALIPKTCISVLPDLAQQPWYVGRMDRTECDAHLLEEGVKILTFLVRDSISVKNGYVICAKRSKSDIKFKRVDVSDKGFSIINSYHFLTVVELIDFHSTSETYFRLGIPYDKFSVKKNFFNFSQNSFVTSAQNAETTKERNQAIIVNNFANPAEYEFSKPPSKISLNEMINLQVNTFEATSAKMTKPEEVAREANQLSIISKFEELFTNFKFSLAKSEEGKNVDANLAAHRKRLDSILELYSQLAVEYEIRNKEKSVQNVSCKVEKITPPLPLPRNLQKRNDTSIKDTTATTTNKSSTKLLKNDSPLSCNPSTFSSTKSRVEVPNVIEKERTRGTRLSSSRVQSSFQSNNSSTQKQIDVNKLNAFGGRHHDHENFEGKVQVPFQNEPTFFNTKHTSFKSAAGRLPLADENKSQNELNMFKSAAESSTTRQQYGILSPENNISEKTNRKSLINSQSNSKSSNDEEEKIGRSKKSGKLYSKKLPSFLNFSKSRGPSAPDKDITKQEKIQSAEDDKVLTRINHQWKVEPKDFIWLKIVGTGYYGEVWEGKWKGYNRHVALKKFKEVTMTWKEIQKEAESMMRLRHPNLVKLYGISINNQQVFLVMEFHNHGSILDYIRNGKVLSEKHLQEIGAQVASGMDYLGESEFIHRDLSARNVLLDDNLVAKIADFGLSRDIKELNTTTKKDDMKMPWKWTAPEAFGNHPLWTTNSDIWSYGVFLWEIYSNGEHPYKDIRSKNDLCFFLQQNRLPKPIRCSSWIYYDVILICWERNPAKRISFKRIKQMLSPEFYLEL